MIIGRTLHDDDAAWSAHQDMQIDAWLTTTPAQRLAWLEEAIVFAHRAGALPQQRTNPRVEPLSHVRDR